MASKFQQQCRKASKAIGKGDAGAAHLLLEQTDPAELTAPDDAVALARLSIQLGRFDQAAVILSLAMDQYSDNPAVLTEFGIVSVELGNLPEAEAALLRAVELSPDRAATQLALGRLYLQFGNFEGARVYLTRAAELDKNSPEVLANLASALTAFGEHEEALKHATRASQLTPNEAGIHGVIGRIYLALGKATEARTHLEKARRLNPFEGSIYPILAGIRKFTEADQGFVDDAERILSQGMPAIERAHLHFALGKVYHDLKNSEKAFEHYRQANLIRRPVSTDDPRDRFNVIKKIKTPAVGDALGELPVLVVGMPRSGTTLIEQIISAHPVASGAGELPNVEVIGGRLMDQTPVEPDDIATLLEEYKATLLRLGGEDALRVVDKAPANFMNLGLIAQLMPKAHVIHVSRSPLDTCLSCYFQNFDLQHWSFDLKAIGEYYRTYRNVMDHWRKACPNLKVLDIEYQALVQDTESASRQMIDFIGLDWDDACLDHTNNDRPVMTASFWQVRQPIYQTSLDRWPPYAAHLQPLVNEIAPYLSDEDAALLKQSGVKVSRGLLSRLFG